MSYAVLFAAGWMASWAFEERKYLLCILLWVLVVSIIFYKAK